METSPVGVTGEFDGMIAKLEDIMAQIHTGAARPRRIVRAALLPGNLPWFRLEIDANGPGIPEEVRQHLFEPFFTTKAIGKGSGPGLWVSWSIIVKRHHG